MRTSMRLIMVSLLLIFITGCAGTVTPGANNPDYQGTKKMVIDLLKSDDGKQAIKDILQDDQIKKEIVMDQETVKNTILETLASKKGEDYWNQLLSDPAFSEKLAKTMQRQDEKVIKKLMNDPSYQEMMMNILKNPSMEKNYLDLMKTKPYREQIQKTLLQTMSSPLVAPQLSDAIKKAVQEEIQSEKSSSGNKQSSG